MRTSIARVSLLAIFAALAAQGGHSARAAVSIGISIRVAPPALPVYVQPPCPAPGYIWTPGYWAYADGDYFWVPGTWVEPPEAGLLWTPGYWGWSDGVYLWHAGYWGPHVGFYGGVDYGYGYTGEGFSGGYWRGQDFYYNRAVANVRTTNIRHVYNKTVINHVTVNRVSYNGGSGGTHARPSAAQERAAHDRHIAFTTAQEHHQQVAAGDRALRNSINHGRPSVAATERPGNFSGQGVNAARAANQHAGTAAHRDRAREDGVQSRLQTHQPQMTRPAQPGRAADREQRHEPPRGSPQPHAQPQPHDGHPQKGANQGEHRGRPTHDDEEKH